MDTSKSVFQLHGVDEKVVVVRRQFRRAEMIRYFERLPPVLVVIESCGSSHHCLPEMARDLFRLQADEYAAVQARLSKIEAKLMKRHREDDISRRIATIPGIGPIGSHEGSAA